MSALDGRLQELVASKDRAIQAEYKKQVLNAFKLKFILEQDLHKNMSQLQMSMSPQKLAEYFAVGMCKVSDALTCSNYLNPTITEG